MNRSCGVVVAALLTLIGYTACAADLDKEHRRERYLKLCEEKLKPEAAEIARLEAAVKEDAARLKQATNGIVKRGTRGIITNNEGKPFRYPDLKTKQDDIERYDVTLKHRRGELETHREFPKQAPRLDTPADPKIGDIGEMYATVIQVIDEHSAIVEFDSEQTTVMSSIGGGGGPLVRVSNGGGKHAIYLREFDTAGLVDGQRTDFGGIAFEIVGTHRYKTALGSKTVLAAEPVPEEVKAAGEDK